jgi:hypothetical protein
MQDRPQPYMWAYMDRNHDRRAAWAMNCVLLQTKLCQNRLLFIHTRLSDAASTVSAIYKQKQLSEESNEWKRKQLRWKRQQFRLHSYNYEVTIKLSLHPSTSWRDTWGVKYSTVQYRTFWSLAIDGGRATWRSRCLEIPPPHTPIHWTKKWNEWFWRDTSCLWLIKISHLGGGEGPNSRSEYGRGGESNPLTNHLTIHAWVWNN